MDFIKAARDKGLKALSEFQSKQVLADYGVPVTRDVLVQTLDEAVTAAGRMGYPVVMKPCSWELMHKSEIGCIELGLTGPKAIGQAFKRIKEKVNIPLEGILIQEMVEGSRELMAGLSRDPQFGVCVMLGIGGVTAEIIADTVFRVAPFDRGEALDMIYDLKLHSMLDAFRGQAPADLETLCRILTGIGRLGLENPDVAEIDLNPLIVSPDGSIKAVDALIIL